MKSEAGLVMVLVTGLLSGPGALHAETSSSPWAHETATCASPAVFELRHEGGAVVLRDGTRPVLAYNYGWQLAAGVAENFRRSSYVHPLFGPDGEILTADFPKDHPHHRGFYWAWPGVWLGADKVDLWHVRGVWASFEAWLGLTTSRCSAELGVRNGWYDAAHRRVMEETAWLRVGPLEGKGRTIDVDLTFAAKTVPVTLQGATEENKGYGGLQYRPAEANDNVITAEGKRVSEPNTDLVPHPWVDYSARFSPTGQPSGVAIFAPPDHPGGAPGWTTRYYGFLGVAWPGLTKITLEPGGAPLHLRYRVYVHRGDAVTGAVAEAYDAYLAGLRKPVAR